MNQKKAKALRREVKAFCTANDKPITSTLVPIPGTRRHKGWLLPEGWLRERFGHLMAIGGPWREEALLAVKPCITHTMRNTPGTFRALYQACKRRLG